MTAGYLKALQVMGTKKRDRDSRVKVSKECNISVTMR